MGDVADMMIEGILCESCGVLMDDITEGSDAPGYPRRCPSCREDAADEGD